MKTYKKNLGWSLLALFLASMAPSGQAFLPSCGTVLQSAQEFRITDTATECSVCAVQGDCRCTETTGTVTGLCQDGCSYTEDGTDLTVKRSFLAGQTTVDDKIFSFFATYYTALSGAAGQAFRYTLFPGKRWDFFDDDHVDSSSIS